MYWILLALYSAFGLGIYDVFKKRALSGNAVIPVLSLSIFISFGLFLPNLIVSAFHPNAQELLGNFYIPSVSLDVHWAIFIKSVIVLSSWICAYFGMKHVPITIFSPIRATQPLWTVICATFIFSETLTPVQVVAVSITLISFFLFSQVGKSEGISWKANHWIWLIILATICGSASGLYDKHLMNHYPKMAVQVYSTMYQSILMLVVMFTIWYPLRKKTTPFTWRWSIIGISVCLMIADYLYYKALSDKEAMISIVSTIRRSGAVVPFMYGAFMLKEKNIKIKSVLLFGVLLGVAMLYFFRS